MYLEIKTLILCDNGYWNQMDHFIERHSFAKFGLDHRFVQQNIPISLQDIRGYEYPHRWLKHTGYKDHIPNGILEDGRNNDQGPKFSHSICPKCAKVLYPDLEWNMETKPKCDSIV